MPVVWESPKEIDEYVASILTTYLIDVKSKIPYSKRSIKNPTGEITEQDIEGDILSCWWLFMKKKLQEHREHEEEQKRKVKPGEVPTEFWLWHPPLYLMREEMYAEYKDFVDKLDEENIDEGREELRPYIGFKSYAYRKSEIRDIEGEPKKHLI